MTVHKLELVPAPHGSTKVMLGERVLSVGRGGVICAAARVLIAEGIANLHDTMKLFRGDMLSMQGEVGDFAGVMVAEGDRPPRFETFKEHPLAAVRGAASAPEAAAGLPSTGRQLKRIHGPLRPPTKEEVTRWGARDARRRRSRRKHRPRAVAGA
jgi:hypothetical protein